ncbi:hypothetical protein [Desulfuribacillus stibiiarsenatis]|uniref:hypothetical protein n=1 Tax=Desulfuribacillus stibiiarsenatis TaxID=1390249 RepID=UPI0015B61252|nr:hypothetical protein [Desulfuribacillus stibiiarsenatis]
MEILASVGSQIHTNTYEYEGIASEVKEIKRRAKKTEKVSKHKMNVRETQDKEWI